MRLSKLERYYQDEFGPRDDPAAENPRPVRPRPTPRSESRRRGPGLFKGLLLLSSLSSLALFVASAVMPCGIGARPSFLPPGLVAAVCARQDMLGQALALKDQFRTLSATLR